MAGDSESVGTTGGERDVTDLEKKPAERWLDDHFEPVFFQMRYFLLMPVLVAFVGAMTMFAVGGYHTFKAVAALVIQFQVGGAKVTLPIIKALDAFLVGIILVIFSFGVYDFFISTLDPARYASIRPDWFKFDSTGELKNKLIEVVLVILAIKFFEQIVANIDQFTSPEIYLVIPAGAAILAVSLGFFKWATE
ncbi:YqhA family protein [Halorarius halobius]|uniref:YqhA family protein n=1 Tax=Halorarius halobius TaxID=2962671 RepID=UPI0020CC9849|nr:YqhA family protein [Halorarius halobius]